MAARKRAVAPKKNKDCRWRVAVHEAGHAVAAHALGVRIGDVTIVQGTTFDGEGYAGRTRLEYESETLRRSLDGYYDADNDDDDDDREEKTFFLLLKSMKVSFAGMLAEELFFGGAEESGVQQDLEAINTCAERLCPPDSKEVEERGVPISLDMSMEEALSEAIKRMPEVPKQEYEYMVEWLEQSTRKLLRHRQELVEAVALKLLERQTLTGAEVVATILAAMKKRWSRNARRTAHSTHAGRRARRR